jgi:hypothetical protein
MKKCNKCKVEKEEKFFHKDSSKKDGLKNVCKDCRRVKSIKYKCSKQRGKFDRNIKTGMHRSIKFKRSGKWEKIVNYSFTDLMLHLESLFDSSMNWNNYGSYWCIDRIIPTSVYRYSNVKNSEFQKCWSIKNCRPLSIKESVKKKNFIIWDLIDRYKLFDIVPIGVIVVDKKNL